MTIITVFGNVMYWLVHFIKFGPFHYRKEIKVYCKHETENNEIMSGCKGRLGDDNLILRGGAWHFLEIVILTLKC